MGHLQQLCQSLPEGIFHDLPINISPIHIFHIQIYIYIHISRMYSINQSGSKALDMVGISNQSVPESWPLNTLLIYSIYIYIFLHSIHIYIYIYSHTHSIYSILNILRNNSIISLYIIVIHIPFIFISHIPLYIYIYITP